MLPQVTAAALVAENKRHAVPAASTRSRPRPTRRTTSRWRPTRRAGCCRWRRTSRYIVGIELLAAAQGCDFHRPLALQPTARAGAGALRALVPSLHDDRLMAPDVEAATGLVRQGAVAEAVGADSCPAPTRRPHDRLARGSPRRGPSRPQPAAHRDRHPGRHRVAARHAWDRAQGHGLAHRPALRVRPRAGRHHRPHPPLAHRHRRQPRPVRRLALPRPGHDRAGARPRPSTATPSTAWASSPTPPRSSAAAPPTSTPTTRPSPPSWPACAPPTRA